MDFITTLRTREANLLADKARIDEQLHAVRNAIAGAEGFKNADAVEAEAEPAAEPAE